MFNIVIILLHSQLMEHEHIFGNFFVCERMLTKVAVFLCLKIFFSECSQFIASVKTFKMIIFSFFNIFY